MPAAISMRAMLPDMSPMTQATRLCFIDGRTPCNSEIVIFGVTRDRWPVTASSQIRHANKLNLWKPGKKVGRCGLEYFEDNMPTERTGQGFNFFIRSAPGLVDLPLLSCPKDNATAYKPLCNSHENLDDTNSFYYTFNRSRICEWSEIAQKLIGLIRGFRQQGARQWPGPKGTSTLTPA